MGSKKILVCVVVAMLGIGTMIAGFVAEATKVKGSQPVYIGSVPECKYPSDQAMGLTIAAIVALLLARGIITSATGGCCSAFFEAFPSLFARFFSLISWFTCFVAIILFLMGLKYYTGTGVERLVNGEYRCYAVWSGVFTGAGIVGFVSVLFGLAYYLTYVSAQNGTPKTSRQVDLEQLEAPPITDVFNRFIFPFLWITSRNRTNHICLQEWSKN
uniref:uncharacterized protein LOC122601809 n=1 Tax=Erigeron canadensis TaxID=72917 RepID=UPI001CB8AAE6|nr:uncharacterized protein LOC122601809 [Erigeron canadensis]